MVTGLSWMTTVGWASDRNPGLRPSEYPFSGMSFFESHASLLLPSHPGLIPGAVVILHS
jgi:hypothetical protein